MTAVPRLPMSAMRSIALTLALCACQGKPPPATSSATQTLPTAAPALPAAPVTPADKDHPTLKVTTFDGQQFDLAAQRGRWVVVNFWATWCGPCLQEIPELTAFLKTRNDVAVIGLDYEENIERPEMEAFLKEHMPGYPIAIVDTFRPPVDFDTPRGLPTSYLIGPNGALVKKFLGPITIKELKQAMDRAAGPAG